MSSSWGRWSRGLARLFIDFTGIAEGDRILAVDCGTENLTFALAKVADMRQALR